MALNPTGMPFDDIRNLVSNLPPRDENALEVTRNRNRALPKREGSLGRMETICEWLAEWSGKSPGVLRIQVALFAGNHAVVEHGFTQEPMSATAEQVATITAGGGAINQICVAHDHGLKMFDLALAHPVNDFTADASFDERGCAATIAFGMEAIAGATDLIVLSGLGVGHDLSASAIFACLSAPATEAFIFSETDQSVTELKTQLVEKALETHRGNLSDPLEVLRRLGGRETAALVGAILAARIQHIPVILDGPAALAAAAILYHMNDQAIAHCTLGHAVKQTPEQTMALEIGLLPMIDLGISHGEACGGGLAAGIVKASALVHAQMEKA